MKDEYELGTNERGNPSIIIHRKPSEIPIHIDKQLMHSGCWASMDGPNSRCEYAWVGLHGLNKRIQAEEYLALYGWKRKEQ